MNQANRNQIRIIAGQYRRRLLSFPDAEALRPTPDRVKETLFNWLGQTLYGKTCLDLFAGSGALGFEAASRGAERVFMIEKSRRVFESLEKNKEILKAVMVKVLLSDGLQYVASTHESFDLIFLDPPFDSELLATVLPVLKTRLNPGGLVYIESRQWPLNLEGWQVLKQARAGVVHYGLLGLAD